MPFNGAKDGKHYWLTPDDLLAQITDEWDIDFDPCPYPKPDDFDGLTAEWGQSNYVNPPFGAIVYPDGKKRGATAWARKAIEEFKKGKRVIFLYPIDKWVLMMLEAGAVVRNLKDIRWLAIEDHLPGKGTGRHIAMFILDPKKEEQKDMFYVIYTKGIDQPRVLGGYSSLKSAQNKATDHAAKQNYGPISEFKEVDDQWIASGKDLKYIIQSGAELPRPRQ